MLILIYIDIKYHILSWFIYRYELNSAIFWHNSLNSLSHPTTQPPHRIIIQTELIPYNFWTTERIFKYKNESFKIPSLVQWTHSKDFVLDPPGLDDQGQFMITFHPLYDFLSLNKVKAIKFQALSIGLTHGSKLWSKFSATNRLLTMAKPLPARVVLSLSSRGEISHNPVTLDQL